MANPDPPQTLEELARRFEKVDAEMLLFLEKHHELELYQRSRNSTWVSTFLALTTGAVSIAVSFFPDLSPLFLGGAALVCVVSFLVWYRWSSERRANKRISEIFRSISADVSKISPEKEKDLRRRIVERILLGKV